MTTAYITGQSGRLGSVVVKTLTERGITIHGKIATDRAPINYMVFAHRYRGEPSFTGEMDAHVSRIVANINAATWADGAQTDRSVVIVASVCATDPVADQPVSYNVSKAAQVQLARYYAKTLRGQGIRCNTVSPAAFTGANPVVSIQQVADVISWLCSPASSGISGQDLRVTG